MDVFEKKLNISVFKLVLSKYISPVKVFDNPVQVFTADNIVLFKFVIALATKAVDESWRLDVPKLAVGQVGIPVKTGAAIGA